MNLQIKFKNQLYNKDDLHKAAIEEIIEILKKLDLHYLEYKDFLYDRALLEDKVWSLLKLKGKVVNKSKALEDGEEEEKDKNFDINSHNKIEEIDECKEERSLKDMKIKENGVIEKREDLLIYLSSGYMVLKAKEKDNKFVISSTISICNHGENSFEILFNNDEKSNLSFEQAFVKDIKDILFDNVSTFKLDNKLNTLEIEKDILVHDILVEISNLARNLLKVECENINIVCNDEEFIQYSLDQDNNYVKTDSKLNLNLINLISLELYNDNFKEEKFEKNIIVLDNYNTLILKSNCEVKEGDFCYIAEGNTNCIAKNLNMSINTICEFIMKYGYYKCLGVNNEILKIKSTEELYRFLDLNEEFNIDKELFGESFKIGDLNKEHNYFTNYNKILGFIENSNDHKICLNFNINNEVREVMISLCEVNRLLNLIIYNNFKEVLKNVKGQIVLIAPMRVLRVLRDVVKEFVQGNMVQGLSLENIAYYVEKAYNNVCEGIIDHNLTFYGKDIDISVTTLDFKGEEIELINNTNSNNILYKSIKTHNLELTFKIGGIIKDLRFNLDNFTELKDDSIVKELEEKFNIKVDNDIKNSNKIYVVLDETNRSLILFSIKNENDKISISKIENKEF